MWPRVIIDATPSLAFSDRATYPVEHRDYVRCAEADLRLHCWRVGPWPLRSHPSRCRWRRYWPGGIPIAFTDALATCAWLLLCLVPAFDGALSMQEWKDALWDRFYTAGPTPSSNNEKGSSNRPSNIGACNTARSPPDIKPKTRPNLR